jgi:hypothetical protein
VDLANDHVEFHEPPPPEIEALLRKRNHDGLGIEMRLIAKESIASKTIFIVTGSLSPRERDTVLKGIVESGFIWPDEPLYLGEHNIRLYRCCTKGKVMRAVEIGVERTNGGLVRNTFSPVTEYNTAKLLGTICLARISGNAIDYLLEDDGTERDRKWPPDRHPPCPTSRASD